MTDLSADVSALAAGAQASARQTANQLVNDIVSQLGLGGPRQHERLLRLHTPLGPDVLLAERAEITQAIGPAAQSDDQIDLLALSTRHDLNPADLLGQPVLLELLTSQSRATLRPFHGHVTHCELLGSDGGLSRYRLTIEPWPA
jgi:type VI secretion system secreted protein VgrG